MCYARLCTLSSLSEASGAAQVHRDWGVIEVSGCIRGIVPLEAVLVVPLLSLFQDEPFHLVVVSFPKDLVDSLLGYDTVDSSFL